MRDAPRLLVLLLIGAVTLAGACGGDDPTIDDSNVTTSSGTQTAATPCETVRQDLERLRATLGVPGGIDELKQMLADGLDQLDSAVEDAADLTGVAAGRVKDSLQQAVTNARSAVAAVADGDFGVAREELGQANEDVGRAWDRLAETCGSS
jgi:hypothetical protein